MGSTAETDVTSVYEEIPGAINAAENYEMQYNNSYTYPESSKTETEEEAPKKTASHNQRNILLLVVSTASAVVVVLLITAIAFCVIKFTQMLDLQSQVDSLASRLNQSIAESEDLQAQLNQSIAKSEEIQFRLSKSIGECKDFQSHLNKTIAQYEEYHQIPNTTATAESIYLLNPYSISSNRSIQDYSSCLIYFSAVARELVPVLY